MSRRDLRYTLRSIAVVTSAVEGQKDVLEVCFVAVDREHVVTGQRLYERICVAAKGQANMVAPALELANFGNPREGIGWRRSGEGHLNACRRVGAELVDRGDEREGTVAYQAHAVGNVLHLGQDVGGKENRCSLRLRLTDELIERLLHERVEPGGRLVEHQELGWVHERLDEADFLPVSLRQCANRSVELETKAIGEGG